MKALIVGCKGQDGTYLSAQLVESGAEVYGISRHGLHDPEGNIRRAILIEDSAAIEKTIFELRPDRIFYLAAHHNSAEEISESDSELLRKCFAVNSFGLLNILDAASAHVPDSRIFYAATPHVFGIPSESPQDETTPIKPISPYGVSKAAGLHLCQMYRQNHGLYCSAGFLYNHESPLRNPRFVTRKIVNAAVAIERGQCEKLFLANLDSKVDWGFAPEYCMAMSAILNLDTADDFIVATGRLRSIKDFVEAVFGYIGLNWKDHVFLDPSLARKLEKSCLLVGDSSKLHKATGWKPETGLTKIARIMVDAERSGN